MRMLALVAALLLGSGQETGTAPVKVPASVMGKQVQSYVQPVYPESAKLAQVEGTVTLDGIIDERGKVRSLTVVSGPEQLRQGTLDAVAKWVYEPYVQDGKPVAVETTILVNYSLGPRRVARVPPAGGSTEPAQAAENGTAPAPQNGPCGEAPASPGSGSTRIPGEVIARTLLTHTTPVYPKDAKKKHITGTVVLHAVIGKDGKIADLSVLCGPVELQASALDAIKQWTYVPYLIDGKPVAIDTTIAVHYDMGIGSADRAKQIRKQSGLPDELPSDDKEVRKANKVAPVYPEQAKGQGIGGEVAVSVLVGLDGHVEAAHAISGPDLLRDAAVDSVQKWTFKPYAPFGQAEKFHTVVTVKFKVD